MTVRYVLGFLFNQSKTQVALIRKNKPKWQMGCLNGIGGKVERFEGAINAMRREFKEETGVFIKDWRWLGNMANDHFLCNVFTHTSTAEDLNTLGLRTVEEEQVLIFDVADLHKPDTKIVSNLIWLVYMCMDDNPGGLPYRSDMAINPIAIEITQREK